MICRFMVSRWESSPVAFYKTLGNISASLQASLEVLKEHGIFFRGINEYEGEESDEDLPEDDLATGKYTDLINQISKAKKTLPVYVTPEVEAQVKKDLPKRDVFAINDTQLDVFKKELQHDLEVLKKIQESFISCGLGSLDSQGTFQAKPENDGKLQALKQLIKDVLGENGVGEDGQEPGNPRKIIVFSYYADTARYVYDYLKKCFPGKLLYMDGSTKNVESKLEVEKHFMSLKANDDAYKDSLAKTTEKMILVCTDVLSEGINLNQAGVVVNYDISYNPVRVIQRRGRIDRIDQKVFERLYSVNFFPTAKGEDINRVGDISIRKMKMIHHILGEDACILSDEEKPRASVKNKAQKNDKEKSEEELEKLTDVDEYEKRMVSDETRVANLFQQGLSDKCGANEKEKAAYQATLDAIGRGRWAILPGSSSNQLYIFKQNTAAFFVTKLADVNNPESQAEQVSCHKAFEEIKCVPDTKMRPFHATTNNPFWNGYQSFISGNAHGLIKPPSPDNQKKAIRCIRMLPTKLKNKTGQMIRKDGMFAQKILTCENINEENIAELIKTTEENYQELTVDNSVEVMFVGISNGESK